MNHQTHLRVKKKLTENFTLRFQERNIGLIRQVIEHYLT